jgi:hypothetical protein
LKTFFGLSAICFSLKIIWEKTKTILFYMGRARRPDPVYPGLAADPLQPISRPGEAHRPAKGHGLHGAAVALSLACAPGHHASRAP